MNTRNFLLIIALMALPHVANSNNGAHDNSYNLAAIETTPAPEKPNLGFLEKLGIDMSNVCDVNRIDDLEQTQGIMLTREQCDKLIRPLGHGFVEDMGETHLLTVRAIGGEHTLAFYRISNGTGANAAMVTYDAQGTPCDGVLFFYCHHLWPVNPETLEGNLFREVIPTFEFNGQRHIKASFAFQEMVMNPETGLKSKPEWVVRWHQDYEIDQNGTFVLTDHKEDVREGNKRAIDELIYNNMKLSSLEAVSQKDMRVMDQTNKMIPQWEMVYKKDRSYIDYHLNSLFDANPARFLKWMATHRGKENNMLPYFRKGEAWYRPSVEKELSALNADEQGYIRSIISNWEE